DLAVRPRKVNMLKDAAGLWNVGGILARGDAVACHHNEFAGLHVALEFRAEQIEGAGFRCEDDSVWAVRVCDAGHRKRAETAWIPCGEDAVARHHDDGKGSIDLSQ